MKSVHVPLKVYIEINGEQHHVGTIVGDGSDTAQFSYDVNYLGSNNAAPISINLPLQEEAFSSELTAIFFDGLLPEGFTRKNLSEWMKVEETDYLSILAELGNECLGSIRIAEEGAGGTEPGYHRLSKREIRDLAAEGATSSAKLVLKSRLSLAGASGKVGLYFDQKKKGWYLPSGNAPSTHIVKQSHVRIKDIVTNEQLVLRTASRLGIDVPESFIINVGNGADDEILLATKRFDRGVFSDKTVDGLRCPLRRHQEDFAQALGIPSAQKYEPEGENYLHKVAELIRRYSSNPIEDLSKLWGITVFNYLVGNADNHIKNLSLLYSSDLKSLQLAPAYDMLSTVIYKGFNTAMSMNIGGVYQINDVDKDAWIRAAKEVGIGRGMAMDQIDEMTLNFRRAIKDAAEELSDSGFERAPKIMKKILNSFNGRS